MDTLMNGVTWIVGSAVVSLVVIFTVKKIADRAVRRRTEAMIRENEREGGEPTG